MSQIYEDIERLDTGKEGSAICEIECAPDSEHVVSRNAEERKEQIPYLLYQLGKSHYMAGDYSQACVWFDKGLSYDLNPKLEYVIDMVETYVNKGIVIEVTDKNLLAVTGGIVQGMSGSPIIQNGKLIGAVTHVFVQDAARGYGIFIEDMLKNVEF